MLKTLFIFQENSWRKSWCSIASIQLLRGRFAFYGVTSGSKQLLIWFFKWGTVDLSTLNGFRIADNQSLQSKKILYPLISRLRFISECTGEYSRLHRKIQTIKKVWLWPLIFLQPLEQNQCLVPNMKDLICTRCAICFCHFSSLKYYKISKNIWRTFRRP